ncbi:MAG: SpoIIE family protein phosphatase [Clostridium sp.]|nr:SpoIIE family protein phosphatase [Clostridium sp.]
MNYHIDVFHHSLNKYGEELCGDHIEIASYEDGKIIVLSDGLGSGVKANILATLTAKIAVTMLKENSTIEDTLDTITKTLPICQVRKMAYSTFTIIKAENSGLVKIIEFDNPSYFYFSHRNLMMPEKKTRIIHGKTILESSFIMGVDDYLMVISDGVVHAGVGELLNFGWTSKEIGEYLENLPKEVKASPLLTNEVLSYTDVLYNGKPGDDATVLSLTMKKKKSLHLFTGPPGKKEDDPVLIQAYEAAEGLKVISGGTTANIISNGIGQTIKIDLSQKNELLPPMGAMEGATLVTEGVLTLAQVISILEDFQDPNKSIEVLMRMTKVDGATRLCQLILEEATEVIIWMGTAVNPAHQEPGFSYHYHYKVGQIEKLRNIISDFGKEVILYTL